MEFGVKGSVGRERVSKNLGRDVGLTGVDTLTVLQVIITVHDDRQKYERILRELCHRRKGEKHTGKVKLIKAEKRCPAGGAFQCIHSLYANNRIWLCRIKTNFTLVVNVFLFWIFFLSLILPDRLVSHTITYYQYLFKTSDATR